MSYRFDNDMVTTADEYEILSALSSKYPDSIHFCLFENDEERDTTEYIRAENIDGLIKFLVSSTQLQMLKRFKNYSDFKCIKDDCDNIYSIYIYQKYIKHVKIMFLDAKHRDIVRDMLLEPKILP